MDEITKHESSINEEVSKDNNICEKYDLNLTKIGTLIEEDKLDKALDLALEFEEILDKEKYPNYYYRLLNDLVYIYITKQYYQRALTTALLKKYYINSKDKDEVNRWYLELAYIHEAIGETHEALLKLTSILENEPNDETKAIVLNNITKIYVDEKNIKESKVYLDKCLTIVNEINDSEGIRYCKYLLARILRLEKNYKDACKLFNELFKEFDNIERESFNYLNEYIDLYIEMEEYQKALVLCEKYFSIVSSSDDLQNKLIFYKNCLNVDLKLNLKVNRKKQLFSSNDLLKEINDLETLINNNKDVKTTRLIEDELALEIKNCENNFAKKLVEGVDSLSLNKDIVTLRKFVFDYLQSLVIRVPIDEITIFIFNRNFKTIIPSLPVDFNIIKTMSFKNNRLYERDLLFDDFIGSTVEKMIEKPQEIKIDLTTEECTFHEPISGKTYQELNVSYLMALPLYNGNNLFGAIIFQSTKFDFLEGYNYSIVKLSKNTFEHALLNCFYYENSVLQNNLLLTAQAKDNSGLFYHLVSLKKMILSPFLKDMCKVSKCEITDEEYYNLICKSDIEKYYSKLNNMEKMLPYEIDYHLLIDNENILVHEQASPLKTNDGNIYYCGTINKVIINDLVISEVNAYNLLSLDNLQKALELKKGTSFTAFLYKVNLELLTFDIEYKEKIISDIHQKLKSVFKEIVYYFDDMFVILCDSLGTKEDLRKAKSLNDVLKGYKYSYTYINYPSNCVRLDDLLGVGRFSLQKTLGFTPFSNEVYASYISVTTFNNCVSVAIMNNSLALLGQELYMNEELIGMNVVPSIKGIYDTNNLKVVSYPLIVKLYQCILKNLESNMMNALKENDTIYFIDMSSDVLESILKNNKDNHSLNFEQKIVLNIKDGLGDINYILQELKDSSFRLILNNDNCRNLSLASISQYMRLIIGFNEEVDEKVLKLVKVYQENVHYFDKYTLKKEEKFIKL